MWINECIADIEGCQTLNELRDRLQRVVGHYGFASFNFLDVGNPQEDKPFYMGTVGRKWEDEYILNDFVHHDPMLALVRRINVPFTWSDVQLPKAVGRKMPDDLRVMNAAHDHGFKDGMVIPLHFRDPLGRPVSCLVVLFWKDRRRVFRRLIKEKKHEISLILLYWIQRVVDVVTVTHRHNLSSREILESAENLIMLTPRERDVLSWAARGKTTADTGEIMNISYDTVKTHIKSSIVKLNASNRTHAVVRAVYFKLIDV